MRDIQQFVKEVMELVLKDIKMHVINQQNIDGSRYDALKYRKGRRNFKTGDFLSNGLEIDNNTIQASKGYEDQLEGMQQYSEIVGISKEAEEVIMKEMEYFTEEELEKLKEYIEKR